MLEKADEIIVGIQILMHALHINEAIIGIDEGSYRLIYSKTKCIEIFVNEGMDVEDALEHYYYNVVGSYVGEKTPIWCDDGFN